MKRLLTLMTVGLLALTGCGAAASAPVTDSAGSESEDGKLSIVTTIFPEYDWVKNVVGEQTDSFDVRMLIGDGVDLHSYQPSVEDIMTISKCDMFVYVGGESNKWVTNALKEAANPDMIVVDLLEVLGDSVREEEIVEGMETEEHEHEHDESGEEGPEYDEHVWLSLKNAGTCVSAIAESVSRLDPYHEEDYRNNAGSYLEKLEGLDAEYEKMVSAAPVKTVVFGDRFPFRYLVDDYGLDYYAAFAGCSAETEASFETIIFLAEKVDDLGLTSVLTIDNSDRKIAQTIVQNTKNRDQKILTLNSMQAVTKEDIAGGLDYLSIMEANRDALGEALGVTP